MVHFCLNLPQVGHTTFGGALHMKENRSGNNRKKLQEKGYYIVLLLCVVAIGVSGYIFISTAVRQNRIGQEETLSVPLTAESLPQEDVEKTMSAPAEEELEPTPEEEAAEKEKLRQNARKLAVPPVKGQAQATYSAEALRYNPTTRDWRLHSAVDLAAAKGQPVSACMAGTVTEVFDDEYLGTTVVIDHDGGYETRYSNLTAMPTVKVGDTVTPGQTIGAVGETAILEAAQEPHLHFELRLDGAPVDPAEVLG